MIRWKDVEFDLRDVFAGLLTITVIIFLVYSRMVLAGQFFRTLDDQQRMRDQAYAKFDAKFDEILSRLPISSKVKP